MRYFEVRIGTIVDGLGHVSYTSHHDGHSDNVFVMPFRNLFPDNIVQASFQTSGTVYVQKHVEVSRHENYTALNSSNLNDTLSVQSKDGTHVWAPTSVYSSGMNTIGMLTVVLECITHMVKGQMYNILLL